LARADFEQQPGTSVIPEKNYFRDFFKFPQFFTYSFLTSTTASNTRREIVLEATPEAKTVHSCTLELPARVSPPSSAFSVSSALKSQSNFLSHEKTPPIIREVKLSKKKPNSRRGTGITKLTTRESIRVP
jgi:hypothetical protein